jgi:arylsulfatase A-like enzyme
LLRAAAGKVEADHEGADAGAGIVADGEINQARIAGARRHQRWVVRGAAGANIPEGRAFDGVDILGRLAERQPESSRTLFWRGRRSDSTWKAVRDSKLKYVIRTVGGATQTEGLYDLDADVGEQHDLLPSRSRDAARLRQLLAAWEKEVQPPR